MYVCTSVPMCVCVYVYNLIRVEWGTSNDGEAAAGRGGGAHPGGGPRGDRSGMYYLFLFHGFLKFKSTRDRRVSARPRADTPRWGGGRAAVVGHTPSAALYSHPRRRRVRVRDPVAETHTDSSDLPPVQLPKQASSAPFVPGRCKRARTRTRPGVDRTPPDRRTQPHATSPAGPPVVNLCDLFVD